MAGSVAYSLSNDGRFSPVRVAYHTSESNPLSKEHAFSLCENVWANKRFL